MALTFHTPLRSSMSFFDNIKKPISRGAKRRIALDNAKAGRIKDELKFQREQRMLSNPLSDMRVALLRRKKNQDENQTHHIVGIGEFIGNFSKAKQIAKENGYTHIKMGCLFITL